MSQRAGVTLTEVLIAIFVMGIGLLSLLTLFPLGALTMAQAIKDERVTMAAQNAIAMARLNASLSAPQSTLITYPLGIDSNVYNTGTSVNLYTTPGGTPALFDLGLLPSNPGFSYPVYIDPQGVILGSNRMGYLALPGGIVHPGFARSSLNFITTATPATQQALVSRFLSVLDDMTFTENGVPDVSPQIPREGRYTWAYFCKAKPSTNPPQTGTDIWVVVYEKRSLASAFSPGAGAPPIPPGETAFKADFVAGSNVGTIYYTGAPPEIRKGTWVLDASILDGNGQPPLTTLPATVSGTFFRVASTTDNGNGTLTVEFQTPSRLTITGGVAIVMDGVVEVFKAP